MSEQQIPKHVKNILKRFKPIIDSKISIDELKLNDNRFIDILDLISNSNFKTDCDLFYIMSMSMFYCLAEPTTFEIFNNENKHKIISYILKIKPMINTETNEDILYWSVLTIINLTRLENFSDLSDIDKNKLFDLSTNEIANLIHKNMPEKVLYYSIGLFINFTRSKIFSCLKNENKETICNIILEKITPNINNSDSIDIVISSLMTLSNLAHVASNDLKKQISNIPINPIAKIDSDEQTKKLQILKSELTENCKQKIICPESLKQRANEYKTKFPAKKTLIAEHDK